MLVRKVHERAPGLGWISGAGRVVRIDDDQRSRRRCDQALDVIEIRKPAARRICVVENRACPNLGKHSRVQWIGRYRDEDLVARLGQRRECQLDPFRRS